MNQRETIVATNNTIHAIVEEEIEKYGLHADLNHIDVSRVTNMQCLFYCVDRFNGDISKWDVSNVKVACDMFNNSEFNGDISKWNVSKMKDMRGMFYEAKFQGDISAWNPPDNCLTEGMFYRNEVAKERRIGKVHDMARASDQERSR